MKEFSTGSSAGPAAATSAGMVPFAIGSETAGSISYPAARCGITGLRPTFGTIGRTGVMSISESLVCNTCHLLVFSLAKYWNAEITITSIHHEILLGLEKTSYIKICIELKLFLIDGLSLTSPFIIYDYYNKSELRKEISLKKKKKTKATHRV